MFSSTVFNLERLSTNAFLFAFTVGGLILFYLNNCLAVCRVQIELELNTLYYKMYFIRYAKRGTVFNVINGRNCILYHVPLTFCRKYNFCYCKMFHMVQAPTPMLCITHWL